MILEPWIPIAAALIAFFGAVFGGGAAGAIFTARIQHKRAEQEKADARTYLARLLAFEFERYAFACAEALSDSEPDGPDPEEPGKVGTLPETLVLPQSPAYQWLDSDLLERSFSFPQDVAAMRRSLSYLWQVTDGWDYDNNARVELAKFGLRAAALARDVRMKHDIAPRYLGTEHWNIVAYMEKKRDERPRE
jgi:hypothetical protein